jgi:hypothetical protein
MYLKVQGFHAALASERDGARVPGKTRASSAPDPM